MSDTRINSFGQTAILQDLDLVQVATPSNPAAGRTKLYFKSDNKLYQKTSVGVESLVVPVAAAAGAVRLTTSSSVASADIAMNINYHGVYGGSGGTLTIPVAQGQADGVLLTIKDEGGAAGFNNMTVTPYGGGGSTIDGALTVVISTNHGVLRLIVRNNNWFII